MNIISIIKNNDKIVKKFDLFIQFLILVSIITFSIETLPDLTDKTKRVLSIIESFIVGIFTIEYIIRVYAAEHKKDYIFSFYGIVDFIAIAPFYIALGIDLKSVRIVRFFRLFRILKISRYNTALQRFYRAIIMSKEEIMIFIGITIMLLYLAAVGIYFCEHEAQPEQFKSIFHSLWWAIATLTTVGYGDVYPITVGGRIFTFFILMIGLGIVAVPAGLLASSLTQLTAQKPDEHDK